MESPQSPHSSSLWVFALSLRVLLLAPHSESISHLDAKLSSTVLLLVGLRVISQFCWPQSEEAAQKPAVMEEFVGEVTYINWKFFYYHPLTHIYSY